MSAGSEGEKFSIQENGNLSWAKGQVAVERIIDQPMYIGHVNLALMDVNKK